MVARNGKQTGVRLLYYYRWCSLLGISTGMALAALPGSPGARPGAEVSTPNMADEVSAQVRMAPLNWLASTMATIS